MSTTLDWLPRNHTALYILVTQLIAYLTTANRLRMGFAASTPQGEWLDATLIPAKTAFVTIYDQWINRATRTEILIKQLQEAEDVMIPPLRQFAGLAKASPLVTNDDLVAMGLPERNAGGGGHNPPPEGFVAATIELPGPRVVKIHFQAAGSEHKAKPHGIHGVEIIWQVFDTPSPSVSIDELIHSEFDTMTPYEFRFSDAQRGKRLYFAMRWENTTGEKGPWSEIMEAIIP